MARGRAASNRGRGRAAVPDASSAGRGRAVADSVGHSGRGRGSSNDKTRGWGRGRGGSHGAVEGQGVTSKVFADGRLDASVRTLRATAVGQVHAALQSVHAALLAKPRCPLSPQNHETLCASLLAAMSSTAQASHSTAELLSIVQALGGWHMRAIPGKPNLRNAFLDWVFSSLVTVGNPQNINLLAALQEVVTTDDKELISAATAPEWVPAIVHRCQVLLEEWQPSSEPGAGVIPQTALLLSTLSLRFPVLFEPFFEDVIDLLVGWAIEEDLPWSNQKKIVMCFAGFSTLWSTAPEEFCSGLLRNLYGDVIQNASRILDSTEPVLASQLKDVTCFLGCYTCIAGCVSSSTVTNSEALAVTCLKVMDHLMGQSKLDTFEWRMQVCWFAGTCCGGIAGKASFNQLVVFVVNQLKCAVVDASGTASNPAENTVFELALAVERLFHRTFDADPHTSSISDGVSSQYSTLQYCVHYLVHCLVQVTVADRQPLFRTLLRLHMSCSTAMFVFTACVTEVQSQLAPGRECAAAQLCLDLLNDACCITPLEDERLRDGILTLVETLLPINVSTTATLPLSLMLQAFHLLAVLIVRAHAELSIHMKLRVGALFLSLLHPTACVELQVTVLQWLCAHTAGESQMKEFLGDILWPKTSTCSGLSMLISTAYSESECVRDAAFDVIIQLLELWCNVGVDDHAAGVTLVLDCWLKVADPGFADSAVQDFAAALVQREKFTRLLALLGTPFSTHEPDSCIPRGVLTSDTWKLLDASIQSGSSCMVSHSFKQVMTAISNLPSTRDHDDRHDSYSILKVFALSRMTSQPNAHSVAALVKTCVPIRLQWLLLDCAKYCVVNRLCTFYGASAETMQAVVQNIGVLIESKPREGFAFRWLLSARSYLQFVDSLQREVESLCNGAVTTSNRYSSMLAAFFGSNVQVCRDWLSRLRTDNKANCLHACELGGARAQLVRQGLLQLSEWLEGPKLGSKNAAITAVLQAVVAQLTTMGRHSTILGLAKQSGWAGQGMAAALPAACEQAQGKFEDAMHKYSLCLESMHGDDSAATGIVRKFSSQEKLRCCVSLADWSSLKEADSMAAKARTPQLSLALALAAFDNAQFCDASELIASIPEETSALDILDLSDRNILRAMIHLRLRQRVSQIDGLLQSATECLTEHMLLDEIDGNNFQRPALLCRVAAMNALRDCVSASPCNQRRKSHSSTLVAWARSCSEFAVDIRSGTVLLRTGGFIADITGDAKSADVLKLSVARLYSSGGNLRCAAQLLSTVNVVTPAVSCEVAKMAFLRGETHAGLDLLWTGCLASPPNLEETADAKALRSSCFILAAQWSHHATPDSNLCNVLPTGGAEFCHTSLAGECLRRAVDINPRSSLAWYRYAEWCLSCAKNGTNELSAIHFHRQAAHCLGQSLQHCSSAAPTDLQTSAALMLLRTVACVDDAAEPPIVDELMCVPAQSWLQIIPQIVGRMANSSPVVQSGLRQLLCNLGQQGGCSTAVLLAVAAKKKHPLAGAVIVSISTTIPQQVDETMSFFAQIEDLAHMSKTAGSQKACVLDLKKVSPSLREMRPRRLWLTGMPQNVTVVKLGTAVTVLPTKTKPKKMQLLGSDGISYKYLLKAGEDLRLDERIAQILRVSNTILEAAERGLHAQHYAVIPVGTGCGLIQWVNGCTSLFSLFRAAQERAQQLPQPKAPEYLSMRPNDLYQQRMVAALRNSGAKKIGPRQDWPAEVVLDVFTELVNTMRPSSSLLSRELWATSLTSADWLSKVDSYSRQLAVTSMLGYLIGLGDRHLDNILINCTTGSVLHIDFNVAFDKGLRLRVPEIVPFRMTQVVKHALGICGTAGMFTHSCETVWSAMRKRKELVGELLEIFVYDPLVDWKGPQPVGAGSGDSDSDEEHDDNSQDEVVQTEPNEHALQIVSGVVAKLSTTLTVHDQVSALISDATNPKRLCLMYEGWCAWM